jgi:hypothetical protein
MGTYPIEVTVYVRLLQEGTEVFRPTKAEACENGVYRLLPTPDYDPEDECWEFLPGSLVKVKERHGAEASFLVAVEWNSSANCAKLRLVVLTGQFYANHSGF